jgi:hypothetical protein
VTSALLWELYCVFRAEQDAITKQYAWPPRGPLSDEELREVNRLEACMRGIAYRAHVAEYEEAGVPKQFEGFHEAASLPIKRGDVVTIRKGVMVKTVGRDAKPAGRTYKVTVDHVLNGVSVGGVLERNPSVVWAGSGGYWSEVDINDVPEATVAS